MSADTGVEWTFMLPSGALLNVDHPGTLAGALQKLAKARGIRERWRIADDDPAASGVTVRLAFVDADHLVGQRDLVWFCVLSTGDVHDARKLWPRRFGRTSTERALHERLYASMAGVFRPLPRAARKQYIGSVR